MDVLQSSADTEGYAILRWQDQIISMTQGQVAEFEQELAS